MRILLVDDDADITKVIAHRFARRNVKCETAQNIVEAKKQYYSEGVNFTAILCDLFLANGENGLDFCEWLESEGFLGPFILVTGDKNGDSRISAFMNNKDSFFCFEKPFELDAVLKVIRECEEATCLSTASP